MPVKKGSKPVKAIATEQTTIVDYATGEVIQTKKTIRAPKDKEPDYIKIYLDCVCSFKGLGKALTPILISLCRYMTWADNQHQKQIISINKFIKEQVARENDVTVKRVEQALTDIVKAEIFKRLPGARGVYQVNPYIIARGQWDDIKTLRAEFDFITGEINPIVETATDELEEE